MSKRSKDSPSLKSAKSYDDWIKLMNIWSRYTDLAKIKQGPALILQLQDEAQETALTLTEDEIVSENGVQLIIEKLDKIHKKKNVTLKKYHRNFETYKRPANTTMQQYLVEFEKRLNKIKSYGTAWSDDLLAYRLLKIANLSESREQLAKATVETLEYATMKTKLNSKDYVAFTRRFVKETVENMDVKELKSFCINALHEDFEEIYQYQSQKAVFDEMIAWDEDVFDDVAKDYDLNLDDDFEDDEEL